MSENYRSYRARNPRFARQPHRRGGGPDHQRPRARGGPVRRVDRRARSHRAARRRREALPRQGRASRPCSNVETELGPGNRRHGRARSGRGRPACCSTPTARRQVEARRQRDPRRLDGRGPRRRRRRGPAALALPRWRQARILPTPLMNIINGGAHADNGLEVQEFMIVPLGAAQLRRGAARRRRDLPRAQGATSRRRGWSTSVGDEGGFAPRRRAPTRRPSNACSRRSKPPATSPARTSRSRSTAPPASSSTRRPQTYTFDKKPRIARRAGRHLRHALLEVSDRLHRGRLRRGRLGGLEAPHRQARQARAARGRRPLRHQPGAPRRAASRKGIANAILIKLNQIGTVTETLETIRMARDGRLPLDHLAPLRRDRRHLHRGSRGRHQRRPDQDRQPLAHRAHRQVQPAPAHRLRARHGAGVRRPGAVRAALESSAADNGMSLLVGEVLLISPPTGPPHFVRWGGRNQRVSGGATASEEDHGSCGRAPLKGARPFSIFRALLELPGGPRQGTRPSSLPRK